MKSFSKLTMVLELIWKDIVFDYLFLLTWDLGEAQLNSLTREDTGWNKTNSLLGLQETQKPINHEEVEAWEHYASVGEAHMEHKEDNEDNVEVMSVETELEDLAPYTRDACRPHD